MDTNDLKFNTVLERLINGERVEDLSREFPAYAAELSSYANVKAELSKVASMRPSEESLRRALSSMRAFDAAQDAQSAASVRISAFFMTYRTALVLPILVVMLVATGAVALPLSMGPEPTVTGGADTSGAGEPTDAGYAGVPQPSGAPLQKNAGTTSEAPSMLRAAQMSAPAEPMPQDQELASVFGSEMRNDSQEAAAAQSTATEEADDSQDVAGYGNAYDANAL